jgi:hypothetical protein
MTLLGNAKNRAWESGQRVHFHARFGHFPTESFIVATADLSARMRSADKSAVATINRVLRVLGVRGVVAASR